MKISAATADDAAAIASIYAPYVAGSIVSFETQPPDDAEMARRIAGADGLYPWFVARDGAETVGFAYACAFRTRPAYRFTVETTVYVADGAHRRGIGTLLYRILLPVLEAQGFAQAIAAITLPNEASVRLHEALGFSRSAPMRRSASSSANGAASACGSARWRRSRPGRRSPGRSPWSGSNDLRKRGTVPLF
jgi:L-amino acid N-acyltransferase YncA